MRGLLLRQIDGVSLLDLFILAGVGAVLVTRLYLAATGYPQVGNGVLHIAHAVWGGLLMGLAIMASLALLSRPARPVIAIAGGIGFGLFVDEIGKFITRDVDYFFQPAAAIIYICFVAMYLLARMVVGRPRMRAVEWLANAADIAGESADRPMTPSERERLLGLLAHAPAEHPLRRMLTEYATLAPTRPQPAPRWWERAREALRSRYMRVVGTPRFHLLVAAVAIFYAVAAVFQIVTLVVAPGDLVREDSGGSDLVQWSATIASVVQGVLTIVAVANLRRSRAAAYRWLERALLVNILLVQVFLFAENQFGAAVGMLVSLVALVVVRTLASLEEERHESGGGPGVPVGDARHLHAGGGAS